MIGDVLVCEWKGSPYRVAEVEGGKFTAHKAGEETVYNVSNTDCSCPARKFPCRHVEMLSLFDSGGGRPVDLKEARALLQEVKDGLVERNVEVRQVLSMDRDGAMGPVVGIKVEVHDKLNKPMHGRRIISFYKGVRFELIEG